MFDIDSLKFNEKGLIPAVVVDSDSRKVLTVAYMNRESLAVSIPVIASGGAGGIGHFIELFKALPKVDAGLAASIFHFGEVSIPALKAELKKHGIPVREV